MWGTSASSNSALFLIGHHVSATPLINNNLSLNRVARELTRVSIQHLAYARLGS